MRTLLIFVLLASSALSQEPLGGPISDVIGDRIAAKYEASQAAMQGKLSDIAAEIKDMRSDRDGLVTALRELKTEREGIVSRITEVRNEIKTFGERWTPLQNLVERLTALVWKLFWFVIVLCGCIGVLGLVGLVLYARLKGFIKSQVGL